MLELPAEPVTRARRSRGACLAIKPVVTGSAGDLIVLFDGSFVPVTTRADRWPLLPAR
jgi:hypothetical protein